MSGSGLGLELELELGLGLDLGLGLGLWLGLGLRLRLCLAALQPEIDLQHSVEKPFTACSSPPISGGARPACN